MFNDLSRMGKYLGQAARMLVGMPDYDTYVEHMRNKHPDKPVMTYEEFFRERQEARYGGGSGPRLTWPASFLEVAHVRSSQR